MKELICIECKGVIPNDCTNYGTPEYPCCIHCYNLAQEEYKAEFEEWVITGKARTKAMKIWEKYLKGEL